ncbi:MAG: substrate-binding domain-containing protein [Candidatus Sphingomonas phytovorans]|nr:substrate-binding domain-containing protein [Sphingomonas sp.]WEK00420.1 MAG: substrate-binding domain-containing protein [Sphingomonas sp.]
MTRTALILAFSALALTACEDQANGSGAGSRDQIKAVGSSTVYPFTTLVAEQFINNTPNTRTPVIESTGTGAGMKLFCAGIGAAHPDIEAASRRMKASEYATCKANGAGDILEIQVGLDGIAFAEANNGPKFQLAPVDIFKAMAASPMGAKNSARTWRDVNPALPAIPIQIYGPPATSGTRDALTELILNKGCETAMPQMKPLKETDKDGYDKICSRVREDGAYIDAGENDNLIVQKLHSNPTAIGIFGYSYLEENRNEVNGVPLNGVEPTYETIAQNSYPGSRPLFLYVKKAHLNAIPGLRQFLIQYSKEWDPSGPLVKRGLIASPPEVRAQSASIIRNETLLDPSKLH